ncbi:4'-phosphopantetheinyl transferase superfamily protein [Lachnospiraceae bacterium]|jgi:4'-phosphopantetheinyl transferase|nr:4'-phosphopantetheinyl transferase superfamily protein [Lachnospiraceae bacterium]
MITVYYTKVSPFLEEDAFFAHLEKAEEDRRKKILAMTDKKSRIHSLMAGSLLHDAVCERLGISAEKSGPFSVAFGHGGKPYLTKYPDIYYSLSHSGEYVCCALGDIPVGADIQKVTRCRSGIARRFFTKEDNRKLDACSGGEREELFFRMWSIKEAYVKLTGRGLSGGLSGFEIDWNEGRVLEGEKCAAYFREQQKTEGYAFCVCTGEPLRDILWKETGI